MARSAPPPRRRCCAFQAAAGPPGVDGICDAPTWTALVEAGYRLGDRLLYLQSPDAARRRRRRAPAAPRRARLRRRPGRRHLRPADRAGARATSSATPGSPPTASAVPTSSPALEHLGRPPGRSTNVAGVRERETPALPAARRSPAGASCVGEAGGLDALATALGRLLQDAGAVVAVLHHPDPSVQAAEANDFEADVYVGLALTDGAVARPPTTHHRLRVGRRAPAGRRSWSTSCSPCPSSPIDRAGRALAPDPARDPDAGGASASSARRRSSSSRRPSWPTALHRALEAWADHPDRGLTGRRSTAAVEGCSPRLATGCLNPRVTRATTVNHSFGHRVWIASVRRSILELRGPRSSPGRSARGPRGWRSRSTTRPRFGPHRHADPGVEVGRQELLELEQTRPAGAPARRSARAPRASPSPSASLLGSRTASSTSRTDRSSATARRRAPPGTAGRACRAAPGRGRPTSCRSATSFWIDGGSWNRRRVLVTAERLLPTRRATSSWVRPKSSMSCW